MDDDNGVWKSKQDERVEMRFENVSYDDTDVDRQYKESYQFRREEDDILLSTSTDIPLSTNIVPSTFDYMDRGPSVDVDVNEQPAGLNEMDRDHGDVRHSTAASMVPPSVSSNHRTELIMPDTSSFGIEDVEVGQLFLSKKNLKMRLSILSINKNFEFKVGKSTKSLFTIKCIGKTCKWSLRAVKMEGSDIFKITKYCSSHTCSIGILNHDHRQVTATVVGQLIEDKFMGIGRIYKPCHIVEDMRRDYGVSINYDKVWHAWKPRMISLKYSRILILHTTCL
ncbi:uncharacterized protein LOC120091780 [Benincasa hispida]|uniref:uncharacterized protein LOC120091780 n=1 Tax=Benincasa hispida TaxID=102211 RepID=UPI001900BE22|nr:uncharacterized protein LOC120091780 [Benincasa hispida]XP_038905829.1 uncharacterized protein LOC120091780 [Benincasa hispida]